MNQEIRNKLRIVVTQCRKLLEDSISQELEGKYGIFAKINHVTADPNAKLAHLTGEEQKARKDILDYFGHIQARGFEPKEALDQLVREIAFTHLNRLCAYKMMEAREVYVSGQKFRDAVSRGIHSNGMKFYLADHPEEERLFNTGQQDVAYRRFLDWLGGSLSDEIGVLFNPNDPANRLYPRQKALNEVLELLNNGGIKVEETELWEEWPKIWSQDETIGWVYQYFTPKEMRDEAKSESRSPRNSNEMAFLNQFFTPRYVVEFLADNTLGRIWYEMRNGDTVLKDQCKYMVRRPNERFLKKGEQPLENAVEDHDEISQQELLNLRVYISYRAKKDPRELKILDPACGSGHFLLYCFDLLLTIYEEAYTDVDIGPALQKDYPKLEDLQHDVPRLILACNLHGIDIDLRASQIAALAIWLRCQRAYKQMGLKKDRPKITRSNFVCAESMPGEQKMLTDFVDQLEPKLLGQLVDAVFDKMKLAGDAGSLLEIEEEIRDAVAEAREHWLAGPVSIQRTLFDHDEPVASQPRFDLSGITDAQFFEQAEAKVLDALRSYAEQATSGDRLQRKLFTEDAMQGFAFVDICRKRFDVVLMNPPFGACSKPSEQYINDSYPNSRGDILASFVERSLAFCTTQGLVGAITSRTPFFLSSMFDYRTNVLGKMGHVVCMADLGDGVLDATVETAMYVLALSSPNDNTGLFIRSLLSNDKAQHVNHNIELLGRSELSNDLFLANIPAFSSLTGTPYCYWVSPRTIRSISKLSPLEGNVGTVRVGLQTSDDFRFLRLIWEISPASIAPSPNQNNAESSEGLLKELYSGKRWCFYSKTDKAHPWWSPLTLVVDWESAGKRIKDYARQQGNSPSRSVRSEDKYFRAGISYMARSARITPYLVPEGVIPTAGRSQVYPLSDIMGLLGILSSNLGSAFARFHGAQFARPMLQASMVQELPVIEFPKEVLTTIASRVENKIETARSIFRAREPYHDFVTVRPSKCTKSILAWDYSTFLGLDLESQIADAYGLDVDQQKELERDVKEALSLRGKSAELHGLATEDDAEEDLAIPSSEDENSWFEEVLSYSTGVVFGRWDVRFALDESLVPRSQKAFERLPTCTNGTLLSPNRLPASSGTIVSVEWLENRPDILGDPPFGTVQLTSIANSQYPAKIAWDGILADDPEHADDIVRRVRDVIEIIWKDKSEVIEKEACEVLAVKELRDYFRKAGNGGFWDDHVARYSKSRRKAPIYWLLQSSKKNYALWLYYHRLDKDLLFKALVNHVEPKIRLETSRLDSLRSQKNAAGETVREARRLGKEVERQEEFLLELRDFEDKLRRAANLHLEPDPNDGVVLNIAPLYELVPWREPKKYWQELLAGKYEWSTISMQLRQKGLVK